jgi:putative oxidoreductase
MALSWLVLAVRVVAGLIFVVSGIDKFVEHAGETDLFDRLGLPWPGAFVYAVGVVEIVGGALVTAGVATRLAAAALAGDMLGAIATAGVQEGGATHLGLAPSLLIAMLFLLWAADRVAPPWRAGSRSSSIRAPGAGGRPRRFPPSRPR